MNASVGPFSNAARNLSQIGRSRACWLAVAVVFTVHVAVTAAGYGRSLNGVFEWLGLSREGVLAGRLWQVATYGVLHGSWFHLGLNCLFVLLIGSRIEHMAGSGIFGRTLVAGVLGGGAAHLLLGSGLLVGLSGGCMALLLMLTTLSPQSRMMPVPVSAKSLGLGVLIAELILTLVNPGLGLPGLSGIGKGLVKLGCGSWFELGHACHVGGAVAGGMMGRWVLRPRVSLSSLRRARARREAR
jgi:membrane associated rhomboid family serine protease